MSKRQEKHAQEEEANFTQCVNDRVARKQFAREMDPHNFWHGLGTIGTVGWTVALPTLLGVLLGIWIDSIWPTSPIPWTLTLLIGGLLFGLGSAWLWLEGERKAIERHGLKKEPRQDNAHVE